jgi:hypothetical protein
MTALEVKSASLKQPGSADQQRCSAQSLLTCSIALQLRYRSKILVLSATRPTESERKADI